MQINGISAFRSGSGFDLSISFHVGSNEEFGAADMAALESAVVDAVNGAQENMVTVAKDGSRETAQAPVAAIPLPVTNLSRPRRGSGVSAPDSGSDTAGTIESPNAQPVSTAEPIAGSARRRRSAPVASEPQAVTAISAPAAANVTAEENATTVRRRRATPEPAPVVTPPASSEIGDVDLAKACSEAATIMGPVWVQGFVKEFQVKNTAELPQSDRREFLDELAKETAAAQK